MGLFKSKKSTKVENFKETVVQHKIIKLTYLQTLAVTGGLANITDLAGETEGSVQTSDSSSSKNNLPLSFNKQLEKIATKLDPLGMGLANSLFGKKVTREISGSIKDSGWHVVKSWLQPEFDKIRYSLGIKELAIAQFTYEKISEVVSKPWISPKEISKVTLIVDEFIPPQFDPGPSYIQYYVKPEVDGQDWIKINPMGGRTVFNEAGTIVPRIINFNSEKPVNSRLEDAYIVTKEPVKAIRLKAVLSRPDSITNSDTDADSYTPILKSYRLLLYPRGGL